MRCDLLLVLAAGSSEPPSNDAQDLAVDSTKTTSQFVVPKLGLDAVDPSVLLCVLWVT